MNRVLLPGFEGKGVKISVKKLNWKGVMISIHIK